MDLYQLENKTTDTAFLEGHAVRCRAVLPPGKRLIHKLEAGETIVIMLSNGAKYKGLILHFDYFTVDGYIVGEIEIIRILR